ncbi:MAG: DUF1513 domain-containing protein [Maritimibacter sp.]
MRTRRGFLAGLLAATSAPSIGWSAAGSPAFIAATQNKDGSHAIKGVDHDGFVTFVAPLPARGHAGASHPFRAQAVVFARRPGQFAVVVDCARGTLKKTLHAPQGHEFNGHGVFSKDGAYLFTSEQTARGSEGRIGVWDSGTYQRVDEFSSHGIGPHEIRLSRDGSELIIANGGIETTPGGRTKLNLDTMRPNLTYLSLTGRLMETVVLETAYRMNSIRHLALSPDGTVAFAMQWQGDALDAPPLLALHRRTEDPLICHAPALDAQMMTGYAGSVSFSGDGTEVAYTSPMGGRMLVFDTQGTFRRSISRTDICGLAPHPEGFITSDGLGALIKITNSGASMLSKSDAAWDNHIVAL